jgi:hypothetical protein
LIEDIEATKNVWIIQFLRHVDTQVVILNQVVILIGDFPARHVDVWLIP